jgi:hypothetical protein
MDPGATNYNPLATQDDGSCTYAPPPPPPPILYTSGFTQEGGTRSQQSMIDQATILSQAVPSVTSQDPDGVTWIPFSSWIPWDGVTTVDPRTVTTAQLCAWVRPTANTIRGLRERFYEVNPFADNTAPTVKEIEDWNLEVIRHVRRLLGITIPVKYNARLMLECVWSDERKSTEVWDATYPNETSPGDSTSGQCVWNDFTLANSHCGDGFFPLSAIDRDMYTSQSPYYNNTTAYPELISYTNRYAQTTGLSTVNTNIPWSVKFARIITTWICSEGYIGHPGPFINPISAREEVGISWRIDPSNPALTGFRGKWR